MALLLRRWIPGLLRCGAASRMISSSISLAESPWLMMEPEQGDEERGPVFRFWCCEKETVNKFENTIREEEKRRLSGLDFMEGLNLGESKLVGSSQGMLAYKHDSRIHLIDPTTFRCTQLPPLVDFLQKNVRRVILPPCHDESGKALMICGVGSLAFCDKHKREWRIASERDVEYESAVYSSVHRRLLCLTHTMKLEAWGVEGKRDWAVQLPCPPVHHCLEWVRRVAYLASGDHTADLFLVLRYFKHVDPDRVVHRSGAVVSYKDPTLYFEVYKIKIEKTDDGRRYSAGLIKMERSLEGATLFVGMNDATAVKMKDDDEDYFCGYRGGVSRDSIYFTYDERIKENKYIGVFDYRMKVPYPLFLNLPDQFLDSWDDLDYPLWFAPRQPLQS